MKLIIVRMKENKKPVTVLGGHVADHEDKGGLFLRIGRCADPYACELANIEIGDAKFGFMWRCQLDKGGDGDYLIAYNVSLDAYFGVLLGNFFADDYLDWVALS